MDPVEKPGPGLRFTTSTPSVPFVAVNRVSCARASLVFVPRLPFLPGLRANLGSGAAVVCGTSAIRRTEVP